MDENIYTVKHYKPENPDNLEVTFGILRSKAKDSNLVIIVCAIYSPPKSRKKTKLVSYITAMYHQLKLKYQDAFFILGGDINDLNIQPILNMSTYNYTIQTQKYVST